MRKKKKKKKRKKLLCMCVCVLVTSSKWSYRLFTLKTSVIHYIKQELVLNISVVKRKANNTNTVEGLYMIRGTIQYHSNRQLLSK